MKAFQLFFILISLFSLTLINCGQNSENKTADNTATNTDPSNPANMQEAMSQAQKQLEDIQGDNKNVTPVNFRKLKELLPERLLDLPRTSHTGQSAGAMGIKISTAEANYRDGKKRLEVKIIDAGGIGISTMSMAAWATVEVDREDDRGYEKTSNWGSFKTLEACRTADKYCSLKLYSEKGIIAEIEGYEVTIAELKQVAEAIKLSTVPGMRE